VGGLTLPVDTADQTMCPVGQTNNQSRPCMNMAQAKQSFDLGVIKALETI